MWITWADLTFEHGGDNPRSCSLPALAAPGEPKLEEKPRSYQRTKWIARTANCAGGHTSTWYLFMWRGFVVASCITN